MNKGSSIDSLGAELTTIVRRNRERPEVVASVSNLATAESAVRQLVRYQSSLSCQSDGVRSRKILVPKKAP